MPSLPPTTSDEWHERLERSRLLDAQQLSALRAWAEEAKASEALPIAKEAVRRKWLTRWQAQQLLAGQHDFELGRYRLIDRVAQGGVGTVYKATRLEDGRTVAVKIVSDDLVSRPKSLARFRREVHLASLLHHPNVVEMFDSGHVGGKHFLVMEFVEGQSLNEWLRQFGKLPIDWACEFARQAALGLQHAHERGLVHRDVKPGNILVVDRVEGGVPVVKLTDFGLARIARDRPDADGELTHSGEIMGTIDYIAPEQARSTKSADIRADIFSLGCTLFRLLTGQHAFAGETLMEKLAARFEHVAPPVNSLRSEIPGRLTLIVARMLARDPAERFATPGEVADALAPFGLANDEGRPPDLADASTTVVLPREPEPAEWAPHDDVTFRELFSQLELQAKRETVIRARRVRSWLAWLLLALTGLVAGAAAWQRDAVRDYLTERGWLQFVGDVWNEWRQ